MSNVVSMSRYGAAPRTVWIEREGDIWAVRSTAGHYRTSRDIVAEYMEDGSTSEGDDGFHKIMAAGWAMRLRESIAGRAWPGAPFASIIGGTAADLRRMIEDAMERQA